MLCDYIIKYVNSLHHHHANKLAAFTQIAIVCTTIIIVLHLKCNYGT